MKVSLVARAKAFEYTSQTIRPVSVYTLCSGVTFDTNVSSETYAKICSSWRRVVGEEECLLSNRVSTEKRPGPIPSPGVKSEAEHECCTFVVPGVPCDQRSTEIVGDMWKWLKAVSTGESIYSAMVFD